MQTSNPTPTHRNKLEKGRKKLEKCYVICSLWNFFVPEKGIEIEDGFIFQGLKSGSVDDYDRKTCDSYVSCILPIKLEDFKDESDFIVEADKVADRFMTALLTKLRLYTRANILNGKWIWVLSEGKHGAVVPAEAKSIRKIYGRAYYVNNKDEKKYRDFLPSFKEIDELSACVAVSRFNSSFERESQADKLIDLMVMLESLFNDSQGDTTYKIIVRASFLLSNKIEEQANKFIYRKYIYEWVHKAYSLRSKILHGQILSNDDEISEVLYKLEDIFINVLIDCFELKRKGKINLFKKNEGACIDNYLMHSATF
jgi:hypothetical protein